mmetsp:Transcript_43354/g.107105  ORF Transcript_43354/g.107105 Transcript_43354/m.107105 type:complete len:210 (+) Transcript_43354:179-808(+)
MHAPGMLLARRAALRVPVHVGPRAGAGHDWDFQARVYTLLLGAAAARRPRGAAPGHALSGARRRRGIHLSVARALRGEPEGRGADARAAATGCGPSARVGRAAPAVPLPRRGRPVLRAPSAPRAAGLCDRRRNREAAAFARPRLRQAARAAAGRSGLRAVSQRCERADRLLRVAALARTRAHGHGARSRRRAVRRRLVRRQQNHRRAGL